MERCISRTETLSSRLRREDLAIRTVSASLRSALREIRSTEPIEQRERLAGVLAWARDSIRSHEDAVARLRNSERPGAADGMPARLESSLDEIREFVTAAERALHGARGVATTN